jgi:hypothetical protein
MGGDGRLDQIAAKAPETRERAILVGASEPALADDIRHQNRRKFPGLGHDIPPKSMNGKFWPAEMWGSISRLNSEFCNLIQVLRATGDVIFWHKCEVK